jgi:hypothetical protein
MRVTFFEVATGRITGSALCSAEDLSENLSTGCSFINGMYDGLEFYIDSGVAVTYPERPNKFFSFNYESKKWVDLRAIPELKTAKWFEIKQARSQAEYAGFTWDGSTFDSNAISQQRITGAVTLAQMDAGFSIGWTLADNMVRQLSAAQIKEVGAALGEHVATQFAQAQDLRTQLDAAQTAEEVAAVSW